MPQFVLISDRPLDLAWAQARAVVAFSEPPPNSDTLSDKPHGFWRLVAVDGISTKSHTYGGKYSNHNAIDPRAGKGAVAGGWSSTVS